MYTFRRHDLPIDLLSGLAGSDDHHPFRRLRLRQLRRIRLSPPDPQQPVAEPASSQKHGQKQEENDITAPRHAIAADFADDKVRDAGQHRRSDDISKLRDRSELPQTAVQMQQSEDHDPRRSDGYQYMMQIFQIFCLDSAVKAQQQCDISGKHDTENVEHDQSNSPCISECPFLWCHNKIPPCRYETAVHI